METTNVKTQVQQLRLIPIGRIRYLQKIKKIQDKLII